MYSTAKDLFQNLKVFPLPSWARPWAQKLNSDYFAVVGEQVPERARVGREGLYIDQKAKTCWIEGPHGAHYYPKYEHYLLDLDMVFHKPLTDRAFAALKVLKTEGLLGEGQHVSLGHEEELRGAFKKGVVRKRFLEFCLERKIAPKRNRPLPLP